MPATPLIAATSSASSSKRPIAPISAGAFGFSLATPSKAPLPPPAKKTPRQPLSRDSKPFITPSAERPGPAEASSSRRNALRLSETPLRAIKKEDDATPRRAHFRLNDLSNPFLPPPSAPQSERKGKRKLNEALNGDSPFRTRPPAAESHEGKELRGVSNLQDVVRFDTIQEYSEADRIKVEEEEGVGVSPRRIKGMRKWGTTPTSLSKRLTDLLSSQTSAVILFYTALQHTLVLPPRLPQRSHRSSITQPNLPIPIKTEGLPSLLSHLRTAPLRLQLTSPIRGRTQYAHIWLCQTLQWPAEAPKIDHRGEVIKTDREPPNEVLCVFQNLPSDCPRIGLDPRLVASRFEEDRASQIEGRRWEVGVWGPWSDADMITDIIPPPRSQRSEERLGMEGVGEDEEGGDATSQEWPDTEDAATKKDTATTPDAPEDGDEKASSLGEKKMTKVVFASRYLIAER